MARQSNLSALRYHDLMSDMIEGVSEEILRALRKIQNEKLRITNTCNKKVDAKSYQIGDLL